MNEKEETDDNEKPPTSMEEYFAKLRAQDRARQITNYAHKVQLLTYL